MNPLFGFEIGPVPLLMLLALGVLLFGRRLPEVGRYLGKGITEFKKGLKGDVDEPSHGSKTIEDKDRP